MSEMNPYYSPEKLGLEIVKEIDDPDSCYSFDQLILWRHTESGDLYYAQDSGCSCPLPFEDFTELAHLSRLTNDTWAQFENAVKGWCRFNSEVEAAQALRTEMLAAAANALRGTR